MKRALPFIVFVALAAVLFFGLWRDPAALPSALIDREAPRIDLPLLHDGARRLQVDELRGQVWLLNVWASWCVPCREELPVLAQHAKRDAVPLYGLNYKDDAQAAQAMLRAFGDPYLGSAVDREGRVGIDYGVYRVPETFVVDRAGRIRYKHLGAVTPEVWRDQLMPVVRSLR